MPHQCTNCARTFADGSKEMLSGCPDCGGTKFQFQPDAFDGQSSDQSDVGDSPHVEESVDSDPTGDAVSRTVGSAAATVRDLVGGSSGGDTTARPQSGVPETRTRDDEPDDGATTGEDEDIIVAESEPLEESDAQATARSQLVEPNDIPDSDTDDGSLASRAHPGRSTGEAPEVHSRSTEEAADEPSGGSATKVESAPQQPAPERSVAESPDAERTDRPEIARLRDELNEQFESIRVVEPGQYELNLMELYDREEYIIALQEDGRYSIQVPETWRDADA